MPQKIAIAVIHGIGKENPGFIDPSQESKYVGGIKPRLEKAFKKELDGQLDNAESQLVFKPVYWAPVIQERQDELYDRLDIRNTVSSFFTLRDFVFHALADSVAYQPTSSSDDPNLHQAIHTCFAHTLQNLAKEAGESAPLCIIAHSMGTAIASSYIWDTQKNVFPASARDNPLERGQTLSSFYTFGSQIPFWAMRFKNFGEPPKLPSAGLSAYYPRATGEWINFFDHDDLLGYPIKNINCLYKDAVTQELKVKVGNLLTGWNTLSHNDYWKSKNVIRPIAKSLANLWKQVN